MTPRWMWCVCAALALATAAAAPEESDSAEDDDHELPLHQEESRNVRPRAYPAAAAAAAGGYNALPSGFRPTPSLAELAGYQQRPQPPQHALFAEPPQPPPQPQLQQRPQQPLRQERPARLQQQQLLQQQQQQLEAEEEEEREEPDRLSQLLQQSKFDCVGKQSGYYADQELACEVFHYCQDSVKHSWICPDGFTFHQVHLICMPPTHDNICQKSAKYHFVNEYLYRPVNEEEVQRKPNVSLRYSDRYYPAEVYHDDRYDGDDDEEEEPRRPSAGAGAGAGAGAPAPRAQPQQVFRSAEEVNIPLGQRRPPPAQQKHRVYDFDF